MKHQNFRHSHHVFKTRKPAGVVAAKGSGAASVGFETRLLTAMEGRGSDPRRSTGGTLKGKLEGTSPGLMLERRKHPGATWNFQHFPFPNLWILVWSELTKSSSRAAFYEVPSPDSRTSGVPTAEATAPNFMVT